MEALMTVALLDERIDEAKRAVLENMGYRTVLMPRHPALSEAMASHPDMLVMMMGGELITEKRYAEDNSAIFDEISSLCPWLKIRLADITLADKYPCDCRLNALTIGTKLFARVESAAEEIKDAAERFGIEKIAVKQGYPACTVLALGDSHAITADRGMARAMQREGINVLLIEDGDILLPPYEYGFIGGASGVHGRRVFFIGDLSMHRNASEIESFCRAAGYEPVSLGIGALIDLGRIIFIDADNYNEDRKQ